ncbi:hypothetical protein PRIPAC_80324 [Pristionchus pacificus]|uniref:G protein-coupled receptor n=1 Tax=Pristionchus pacificus TaxID=54126 RepID=A0A2A6CLI2_PRIPA|nr:hypothetical protein PRIPAC_80324 [Pristionchus pacificus]|eukprot:PDM79064.1 G protein-coupled receptor [Pristionchus pacificus]
MSWLVPFTQGLCIFEGGGGVLLNLYLFYLVVISKRSSTSDPVYKIAISFFSVHGFTLCAIIAVFNFGHLFREGTFVAVALNPLAQFLPMPLNSMIFRFLLVLLAMMWTLIPATSTLQLITLSHLQHWSKRQRLFVSFLFPFLCGIMTTSTVEDFIPSQAFEQTMRRISQEFYEVNSSLIVFGGTMRYPEENYDRTLTYFAVFYAIIPYSFTYAALGILIFQIQKKLRIPGIAASERTLKMQRAFFTMQLLQSALPLAILATPFTVFVGCVFTQTDLPLPIALCFTSFLWLCPAVQALVQLRYIRQAIKARSMEATTVTVSVIREPFSRTHSRTH